MDPDPVLCIPLLLNQVASAAQQHYIEFTPPTWGVIIAIIVAFFGLFLSAFNSGSEIAFFSLKKHQIDEIDNESSRESITSLLKNPEKLLATILIGNNLVNVMIIIVLNYAINQMVEFNSPVVDFI